MLISLQRLLVACFLSLAGSCLALAQAPSRLHATAGHDAQHEQTQTALSPQTEVTAAFQANLPTADHARRGEAWFVVSADLDGPNPQHVTIRIPISSTEDAYGESRSCTVDKDGSRTLTFTAGLDEDNFVGFRPSEKTHDFRFLLNKYLCRVVAAPFHCGDQQVALPRDLAHWRFAGRTAVLLSSDAPASLSTSDVALLTSNRPFDYARCAVVAPSNGMCCVAGRTTEWHCGGTPAGEGWHQVSGECFHRETGETCKE